MKTITSNNIEFTRVNNDTNGNPRYVCHFLSLLTDAENERLNTQYSGSFSTISEKYAYAIKKAKQLGGRKFHNKQFGGGVVFQSYNIDNLAKSIIDLNASNK